MSTVDTMKQAVLNMQDDKGQPIVGDKVALGNEPSFLKTVTSFLGITPKEKIQSIAPRATKPFAFDRIPGTLDALEKLTDEQKVMLAACTSSGCDAVAYYTPAANGGFEMAGKMNMYPKEYYTAGTEQPVFGETLAGYQLNSFAGENEVRVNKQYHLPVYAVDANGKATDQLKGVIVLHAPTHEYSQLQAAHGDNTNDMHEPVASRIAKLELAKFIVSEHQDLFGASGERLKAREAHHRSLPEKISYFEKLIEKAYATFPPGNQQQAHMDGVANLMRTAVENVVEKDSPQEKLIYLLARLHDVGKLQMSSAYMRKYARELTAEEKKYFDGNNENHPVFTATTLLIEGKRDAVMSSSHHHGICRYTCDERIERLGADAAKYKIVTDNLKPDEVTPLSRLLRICDVSEAITGDRKAKPIHEAIEELASKVHKTDGKSDINPGTIDGDYLCFAIQNGLFEKYAKTKPGYDEAKLKAKQDEILKRFEWTEAKQNEVREALMNDPLLQENSRKVTLAARSATTSQSTNHGLGA